MGWGDPSDPVWGRCAPLEITCSPRASGGLGNGGDNPNWSPVPPTGLRALALPGDPCLQQMQWWRGDSERPEPHVEMESMCFMCLTWALGATGGGWEVNFIQQRGPLLSVTNL